jgi:hypothetical protein
MAAHSATDGPGTAGHDRGAIVAASGERLTDMIQSRRLIRRPVLLAAFCAGALLPACVAAQESTTLRSFEATYGQSYGHGGGDRQNRDGPALDALLSSRPRRPGLHLMFGIGVGVQGSHGSDVPCTNLPGDDCVPDFPRVYTLGILAGVEKRGRFGAARLMAGPTHFRADGGGGALGGQARLEFVSPPAHRIAAVLSARGGLVWNLDRQDYRLGAIGIGLGIY